MQSRAVLVGWASSTHLDQPVHTRQPVQHDDDREQQDGDKEDALRIQHEAVVDDSQQLLDPKSAHYRERHREKGPLSE
eukprot:2275409-Prymnesium_polylepis.2